jgi:myo-inositol 2-dehydrogenase/D-chiro-inositol 1-dehydrogenase/scyllo-inositol 2-dehydrogenase (NAD+)
MKDALIGVCVIGAGRAGMMHARNLAATAGAALAAIADPEPRALRAASDQFPGATPYGDYRQALQDRRVQAVVVASPTGSHRDIVVAAAKAGKHVFCEKPMAVNVAECEEMIAAAARHNVKLQIGFMRRFDAGFIAAKARIDSGEIGQAVLIKSLTHGPNVPKPWMYDISKSNGPLAEVASPRGLFRAILERIRRLKPPSVVFR